MAGENAVTSNQNCNIRTENYENGMIELSNTSIHLH